MAVARRVFASLIVAVLGCMPAAAMPPESALPRPVSVSEPPTISTPPSSTPDLELAVARVAAAGIDLRAPSGSLFELCSVQTEPYPPPGYTTEQALALEALQLIEHHAREPQLRDAARVEHIRLRLAHCDLAIAADLLESFVIDHDRDLGAAVVLSDALTLLWMAGRTPAEIIAASDRLAAWLDLVVDLPVWTHADAGPLRDHLRALHTMGIVSSCRLDGSHYDDGEGDGERYPHADEHRRCAEELLELAQDADYADADIARHGAADLLEAAGELGRAEALRAERPLDKDRAPADPSP